MESEQFEQFFKSYYEQELLRLAAEGKKSILVDFRLLDKFDPILGDKLLNDPLTIIEEAKRALENIDLPEGPLKIIPRFDNLPEQQNIRIRKLRAEHMGKFLTVEGIVKRTSEVKPNVSVAVFECPDCQSKLHVEQKDSILKQPSYCECGRKSGFDMLTKQLFDVMWLVVEEPYDITEGEQQSQKPIYLSYDLTNPAMQNKCEPGNRLKINGILMEKKKIVKGKEGVQLDTYIQANYFEATEIEWEEVNITEENIAEIKELAKNPDVYNKLIKSIAPSIYGMDEVKEALLLQMFGGVARTLADGVKLRGDIHVLLLGDPSTAKTQLLKLVSQVIPRGKYVSGKGTSAAGLTATVVKDEMSGGWALEAGAMVLANKGIIAIDEFDKISTEDQVSMHEAMSTQTISIAKASIVATLPSRVGVLAGANPKLLRFDPGKGVAEQITIPDTLLSRFDLKFALRDVPNKEKDAMLAGHVFETRLDPKKVKPDYDPMFLRKYITYAKKNCEPELTRQAAEKLKDFYLEMRAQSEGDMIAITLRQSDALFRLAESSAKIRLSELVEVPDAVRAINIMRYSLMQLGYDSETGRFDVDKIEGSVSASKRTKINTILDILAMLEKKLGKPVAKEEVFAAAEDEGISANDVKDILNSLKAGGETFQPKPGYVQRV